MPCRTLTPPCPPCGPDRTTGPHLSRALSPRGPRGKTARGRPAHSQHAGRCRPVPPARTAGPRTCQRPRATGQTTTRADFGAHPCILLTVPQASTPTGVSRGPRQGWGLRVGTRLPRSPCSLLSPTASVPPSSAPAMRRPASPSRLLISRRSEENAPCPQESLPRPADPQAGCGCFFLNPRVPRSGITPTAPL